MEIKKLIIFFYFLFGSLYGTKRPHCVPFQEAIQIHFQPEGGQFFFSKRQKRPFNKKTPFDFENDNLHEIYTKFLNQKKVQRL